MILQKGQERNGAMLMEVLIATIILLVAVSALASQALVGMRAATRTQLQTLASTLCQSTLAEQIAIGFDTSSASQRRVELDGWMIEMRVEPLTNPQTLLVSGNRESLALVSVTAWQPGRNERLSRVTLTQIVRRSSVPATSSDFPMVKESSTNK